MMTMIVIVAIKRIISEWIATIFIYIVYNIFKGSKIHGNMKNTLEENYWKISFCYK